MALRLIISLLLLSNMFAFTHLFNKYQLCVRIESHSWYFLFLWLVENENHCDFVKLREMLICTNMEDLRDQTHTRHYELYRRRKLEEMGFMDVGPENQPLRWAASHGRRWWWGGWYLFIYPGWRENLPHCERPLDDDLLSRFLWCLNYWKASCSWRSLSPHPTQGVK